ncbi:netrin receptor DCC-like [Paramacrobiotus metropolitanus]|uniref:netrin receptor DCC-like n=1 Tax=Paramacrobiotus metropolitanus TaxID=2943436 RepID=UPI002445EA2C|nr:netrin receptor DCC-like [Paramacrobiotus metropolitanus]XP_055348478.1 netrin receptor DCC-like [Paramacrobiotus metropolitanus]
MPRLAIVFVALYILFVLHRGLGMPTNIDLASFESKIPPMSSVLLQTNTRDGQLAFTDPKPPRILEVFRYQSFNLRCEAAVIHGPPPRVYWMRNGSIVSPTDDQADVSPTNHTAVNVILFSVLSFNCVVPGDSGDYVCVAETPTARIQTTTKVIVNTGPFSRSKHVSPHHKCSAYPTLAPHIFLSTRRYMPHAQDDVVLHCRSTGSPPPRNAWYFHAGLFRNATPDYLKKIQPYQQEKYQILGNGDLVVKKATVQHDLGYYICGAMNLYGEDYAVSFLQPVLPAPGEV